MAETLFISDLHLDKERPEIIKLFTDFLDKRARHCDALYILGDLFEYWIGDDQPLPGLEPVLSGLADCPARIYFVHGNRDFLIGPGFAARTGITLLPETRTIDLYGRQALILHGDTLCTDDIDYQQMRTLLRAPDWQTQFLALPLETRIQQALALRQKSRTAMDSKAEDIMDVNPQAVVDTLDEHQVHLMIHGHTHRPAIHDFMLDHQPAQRIVLGDWYHQGSVLRVTPDQTLLETVS